MGLFGLLESLGVGGSRKGGSSVSNINVSGGRSQVNINGMKIEVMNGRVFVNGDEYDRLHRTSPMIRGAAEAKAAKPSTLELKGEAKIVGDINGDLIIQIVQPDGKQVNESYRDSTRSISLTVEGSILGDVTVDQGTVKASQITGDVKAGGDVDCQMITGDVSADGSVNAQMITGDVHER